MSNLTYKLRASAVRLDKSCREFARWIGIIESNLTCAFRVFYHQKSKHRCVNDSSNPTGPHRLPGDFWPTTKAMRRVRLNVLSMEDYRFIFSKTV